MSELCLAARGAIVRGVNPPLSDLLRPGEFLVAYDYGMGGLWGVLIAPSVDAIADRYPELSVADAMPPWMTTADLERHREAPLWLDDEPPQGLLKALVADRERD
jgi:hypothetical protein